MSRMQFLNQLEDAYGFHGYKKNVLPQQRYASYHESSTPKATIKKQSLL